MVKSAIVVSWPRRDGDVLNLFDRSAERVACEIRRVSRKTL
jgi:hypothetical protein